MVFGQRAPGPQIAGRLEDAVAATFGCRTSVVLRSQKEMQTVVARAPKGFGTLPDKYRYDVIFLNAPLTAESAIPATRPGVGSGSRGRGRPLLLAPRQQGVTESRWTGMGMLRKGALAAGAAGIIGWLYGGD